MTAIYIYVIPINSFHVTPTYTCDTYLYLWQITMPVTPIYTWESYLYIWHLSVHVTCDTWLYMWHLSMHVTPVNTCGTCLFSSSVKLVWQMNGLCNLLHKKTWEVAASLPGWFLSRWCFTLCITMEFEHRTTKQYKCHLCCSCKNYQGKGMEGGEKSVFMHFTFILIIVYPVQVKYISRLSIQE